MSGSSSSDDEPRRPGEEADDSNGPSSSNSTAATAAAAASSSTTDNHSIVMNQELPFLVTHWLANFAASSSAGDSAPPVVGSSRLLGGAPALAVSSADVSSTGATAEEREEAIRRLHRAAGDIASAFTTLGIFGSATTVSAWVVLFVSR